MSNYDFSNKKLYNGAEHHEGMNVVPFIIENRTIAIELGVKPEFMETHHTPSGKKYLVSFTEVPEEQFDTYMSDSYNQQIRDYFDNYGENSYKEQFARCKINGKVCLMYKQCSKCQEKNSSGELLRDCKQGIMSLDRIIEDGYDPTAYTEADIESLYAELLEEAGKLKAYFPEIIKRLHDGEKRSDIVKDMHVKKSRAYKEINAALDFVKSYLTD